MNIGMRFGVAVVFAAVLLMRTAVAHHSVTIYDYSKVVTLQGTVELVEWTNPHSYVRIMTQNASGVAETWRLEYGTPGINARMGWRKDSIKAGDKLTVTFSPIRDGTHEGAMRTATFPDGHFLHAPAFYFHVDSSGRPGEGGQPNAPAPDTPAPDSAGKP